MVTLAILGDRAEEIEDIIDANYTTLTEAQTALNKANGILSDIDDTAYIKTSVSMQVPFMPVIYKTKDDGCLYVGCQHFCCCKGRLLAGKLHEVEQS